MTRGLETIDWAGLTHAYGPAEDVPELLAAAGGDDEEEAAEALDELTGSLFHQGTVYPATVAAVPFLVELAATAAHGRAEFAWTVGMLADAEHAYGESFGAVRAAVAAQAPALIRLLGDSDVEVRAAAAYAVARAGGDAAALWERWRAEPDDTVRGSLLLALGALDPAGAADTLRERATDGPVALAAAVALRRAGLPWPDGTAAAVVAAMEDGQELTYSWALGGGDWSDELTATGDTDLLTRMLASPSAEVRESALWGASRRNDASRSAPAVMLPLVAGSLRDDDPDVRGNAVDTVTGAGRAAGAYADELAALAAGFPAARADQITAELKAVEALAKLGDPRWIEPVCAAGAGRVTWRLLAHARPAPEVVAAVRARLAAEPARADVLAAVLGTWREGVPELLAALPHAPKEATGALLTIGHDDPAMLPELRSRTGDAAAAAALHRMTGDVRPTLAVLAAALAGEQVGGASPGDLTEELRPLLPAARVLITGRAAPTIPERERQILAARIVAAPDGVAPVVDTVRAVLTAGHTPARAAADAAGDLGLTVLEPELRDRLGDRWSRVAAARALVRLGLSPVAELTEPLVRGVTDYAARFGLDTILELHAVDTIPSLEALTEGDQRTGAPSDAHDVVWADERLVDRIRTTIEALRD